MSAILMTQPYVPQESRGYYKQQPMTYLISFFNRKLHIIIVYKRISVIIKLKLEFIQLQIATLNVHETGMFKLLLSDTMENGPIH